MRFNSVKRGNFSGLAGHVNRATDQVFAAARETAVDNTAIAKEAIKGRSMERRAAMKAEGKVARAGLEAVSKTKMYGMKADAIEKEGKRKGKKARMAGVLGALGALAGGYVIGQGRKADKKAADEREAAYERRTEEMLKAFEKGTNVQLEEIPDAIPFTPPKLSTDGPTQAGSDGSSSGTVSSSSSTPSVSANISAQHSFDPSKRMTREQITSLAESVGFSPEAAQTVYGIAGGESGFDPTNSTKRSGLYAKTGEDSVGLMQINWGYHKNKGWLQNMGITSREQLLDPATNMKAAKYLYDGRGGGFQDWTVYNKGIYKNYL